MSLHEIAIRHTWDGSDAPGEDHVLVRVSVGSFWEITVDAPFHGDPPPDAPPGPTDRLWEHEVVELFVVGRGDGAVGPPYTEIELGPHGHYLILQLFGVRQVVRSGLEAEVHTHIDGERWHGRLVVPSAVLPASPVVFNAYAIHGPAARRRYFAHGEVPGDGPDFHRLQHFPAWPIAGRTLLREC